MSQLLPFDTLSDERRATYFADGVQDEILSTLAKGSRLRVVSRTSVMRYRASGNRNLPSIAAALGVANVVEGTVRRSGNRVRIVVRLVAARRDETLWSDSYDRELTDIFAIQRDIAQTVASKLSVRLAPGEQKGIEEKPTADDERPFVADPEFTPFDLDALGCDPQSAPASPSDLRKFAHQKMRFEGNSQFRS